MSACQSPLKLTIGSVLQGVVARDRLEKLSRLCCVQPDSKFCVFSVANLVEVPCQQNMSLTHKLNEDTVSPGSGSLTWQEVVS